MDRYNAKFRRFDEVWVWCGSLIAKICVDAKNIKFLFGYRLLIDLTFENIALNASNFELGSPKGKLGNGNKLGNLLFLKDIHFMVSLNKFSSIRKFLLVNAEFFELGITERTENSNEIATSLVSFVSASNLGASFHTRSSQVPEMG